ncbi:hypothetical protein LHK22_14415, partial [Staphylococcus argenteus]|nr:hypothetical protein [Staphylococcus argenteus]
DQSAVLLGMTFTDQATTLIFTTRRSLTLRTCTAATLSQTLDKIQKAEEYTDLVKEFVYCDYSKTIRTKANHCVLNFDERSRRWIVDIDPGVPSEIAVLVFELFHTSHDFRWCTSESGKADILTKHIRANLK